MKNKNRRLPALPPLAKNAVARASQNRQAEIQFRRIYGYALPSGNGLVEPLAWLLAVGFFVLACRALSFFIHHS